MCGSVVTSSPATLAQYSDTALTAASQGRVGVLLLAGGQGTRLGVPYPKVRLLECAVRRYKHHLQGMYDIGLPSGKTLYQIQMERILRLEELSRRLTGVAGRIQMYIMTSEATKEPTQAFLEKNGYFGLCRDQVTIFEQRVIPAFDMEVGTCLKFNLVSRFLYLPGQVHHGDTEQGGALSGRQRRAVLGAAAPGRAGRPREEGRALPARVLRGQRARARGGPRVHGILHLPERR